MNAVQRVESLYGDEDPRLLPSYGMAEAAHYLRIPRSALRSWVLGHHYRTGAGRGFFEPVIAPASRGPTLLSFMNLVEAHVLDAIRQQHDVHLQRIREALLSLEQQFPSKHPLAEESFETVGKDLFVERLGHLINISRASQLAVRELLLAHLRRIERDRSGTPRRLYPFTRNRQPDEPRLVVIDPLVSFGRPVISGTGIPTVTIAERYKAGESIDDLAGDYDRQRAEIEEAIRCELEIAAT